jgi:propionate CoA-transferase
MMRRPIFGAVSTLRLGNVTGRFGSSRNKVVSVEDAVYLVPDGATITVGGFVAQGSPEYVLEALGQRFRETGSPNNLTLLFGGGPGDSNNKGLNHFAHPGMLKRLIAGHYGQAPMLGKMALDGAFEAYFMPMGCVSRMIRCAASNSPGHLSKVGFGTMMDPALGGGKLNSRTTEDIVKVIEIEGEKYLFYPAMPIDVALIRGTTADPEGNITMERESLLCDHMLQAMAGRSRRGVVIAQVERVGAIGSLNPRQVRIPGTMVDCVVQAPADKHTMSYWCDYDPAMTGEIRLPPKAKGESSMELDERKIIARRAVLEIMPDQVINLGIGMPEGVAKIAEEENILQFLELTTEPGVHGGVGVSGHNFGPATNADALIEMHSQFDFYNGGGLDVCFLGSAETDANGNVNVTRAGPKLTGPGGFIDISQCTKRVNLMGTFMAGGLKINIKDGKLVIEKEGRIKKFVKAVKEITFSGEQSLKNHQTVNYITERCVFTMTKDGMELIEVAPGIDLQTQILDLMDFKPLIREPLGVMDPAIFRDAPMDLLEKNFSLNMEQRLHYDKDTNTLYVDMKHVSVYEASDLVKIEEAILVAVKKAGCRVNAIVSYDNFDVAPRLTDAFVTVTKRLEESCYNSVRRISHRAFSRHKLQAALSVSTDNSKTLTYDEALEHAKKTGLMISPTTFLTLFKKAALGEMTISLNTLNELISKAHR